MRQHSQRQSKLPPIALAASLIAVDQLLKALVAASILETPVSRLPHILDFKSLPTDWIRVVFVRNSLYAFGLAGRLSLSLQAILFGVVPCLVFLGLVAVYPILRREVGGSHKWSLAILVAGVLSNTLDRALHQGRVTDYILPVFLHAVGINPAPIFNLGDLYVAVAVVAVGLTVITRVGQTRGAMNSK